MVEYISLFVMSVSWSIAITWTIKYFIDWSIDDLPIICVSIVLCIFSSLIYFPIQSASARQKEQEWLNLGCPVYSAMCGDKQKIACEVKANKVGKIQIDNYFVESYPTCK